MPNAQHSVRTHGVTSGLDRRVVALEKKGQEAGEERVGSWIPKVARTRSN